MVEYDLGWLIGLPAEDRPKRLVPCDHILDRSLQLVAIELAPDTHGERAVVGGDLGCKLIDDEQRPLGEGGRRAAPHDARAVRGASVARFSCDRSNSVG